MIKTINTRAIILGTRNLGESDKVVYFYTESLGKIEAIAKGARKINSKFTGHLEILNIAQIELYFGKNKSILREIITEKPSTNLQSDLDHASSIIQLAEITNRMLFENQNIDDLFPLIEESCKHLHTKDRSLTILLSYLIKFLDITGFMPEHHNSETDLDAYYENFFRFVKEKPFDEIAKISLRKKEKNYLKNYLEKILHEQTQIKWQLLAS